MAVTCGFTRLRCSTGNKPQLSAGCDVSEGGLEPLAYILGASAEPWLSI